jgi:hypothetical protein
VAPLRQNVGAAATLQSPEWRGFRPFPIWIPSVHCAEKICEQFHGNGHVVLRHQTTLEIQMQQGRFHHALHALDLH